jgi:hypothetical protein
MGRKVGGLLEAFVVDKVTRKKPDGRFGFAVESSGDLGVGLELQVALLGT